MNDNNEVEKQKIVPNDHLANERTSLAWIRTGIAIMAFGFVVVKFSFFLQQFSYLLGKEIKVYRGHSDIIGILIVVAGVLCFLFSFIQYKLTEKKLLNNTYRPSSKALLALVLVLAIIGFLLIFYLIQNVQP